MELNQFILLYMAITILQTVFFIRHVIKTINTFDIIAGTLLLIIKKAGIEIKDPNKD